MRCGSPTRSPAARSRSSRVTRSAAPRNDSSCAPPSPERAGASPERARYGPGMSTIDLAGRRIVVVGAGTQPSDEPDPPLGNGRAIALRGAGGRAEVVCVDRAAGAARATAPLVPEAAGHAPVVVADVA